MTWAGENFMEDDPQILLRRFAEYVRPYPAKSLALMGGCAEKTAEHWRNGVSWPTARHWKLIVRAFGRDVLAAVFDPEINDTLARLRREEAQLEERLEQARARRRRATAGGLDLTEERRGPALADRDPLDADLFGGAGSEMELRNRDP